jgi:hypothetical protein
MPGKYPRIGNDHARDRLHHKLFPDGGSRKPPFVSTFDEIILKNKK